VHPETGLSWAAPTDQSGTYGFTEVSCSPVVFGKGLGTLSLLRAYFRLIKLLGL